MNIPQVGFGAVYSNKPGDEKAFQFYPEKDKLFYATGPERLQLMAASKKLDDTIPFGNPVSFPFGKPVSFKYDKAAEDTARSEWNALKQKLSSQATEWTG